MAQPWMSRALDCVMGEAVLGEDCRWISWGRPCWDSDVFDVLLSLDGDGGIHEVSVVRC